MKNAIMKPLLLSAAIAATFAGPAAQAAGFALMEQSASAAGTAFAGKAALGEDASSNWFNPASISRLKRQEIVGALHLIKINAKFNDDGTSRDANNAATNNGGNPIDPTFIPNFHYVRPINEKTNFGFSLAVPFGLATKYDPAWVGRFQGVKSEIKTIDLNPSFSYQVDENLSVGAGVSVQYLQAKLTQAQNYATSEGVATIKGDNVGYGYNVGALLQASPSTRLGLAWRSEIKHNLEGTVDFAGNAGESPAVRAATANSDVRSSITLPGSAALSSVTALDERWNLLTDITWTNWSKIQELSFTRVNAPSGAAAIPSTAFRWRDTMRYAVGATRQMNEKTKIKFGVAFDETPVTTDLRGVRLPDENRLMFAAGSQYQLDENCKVDLGVTYFKAAKANINSDGGNQNQYGLVSGHYKADAYILSAQFSHRF